MGSVDETVVQDCAKGLPSAADIEASVITDCAKGLAPADKEEAQTVFQAPAAEVRVLNPAMPARAELVVCR